MPRIGTLILVGLPLGFLPWHRDDRFPRSTREPAPSSRHLHAGRHSSSRQVASRAHPGAQNIAPVSTSSGSGFDMSSVVRLRSSSRRSPDAVTPRLFPQRSPPRLLTAAAWGGLKPAPASRLRGAFPHLSCSYGTSFQPLRARCRCLVAHILTGRALFPENRPNVLDSVKYWQ